MVLCRVNLHNVTPEDIVTLKSYYFFPLEKIEEQEGRVILNAMGGELCSGTNDFGEDCKECRYAPEIVRKYLKKEKKITIGKEGT